MTAKNIIMETNVIKNVGAIQKWLEGNSRGTLAGVSEGEMEGQELSIEIF